MRIGLIAPPWVPVPPVRYGGTEQVVNDLACALTARGHDIRLFTVGESTCPVSREWYFDTTSVPMGNSVAEAAHVLAAYQALADVDVIHDHTVLGPLVAGRFHGLPPVVTTNHGPFTPPIRAIFGESSKNAAVIAISHSQRASAPEIPVAAVIHHGIDLHRHSYGEGQGDYVLFVGRMSPDKGLDRAIHVARRAGRRLIAISKMREPDELAYFERHIVPLLGDDIELLDEPSAEERLAIMRSAQAVLNPICWPEPFGLVMAESLACGTPVLAFPNGAAPEIVDDGKTGYLCAEESDMVWGLSHLDAIDRQDCRLAAEQRFDRDRMAADHEQLYEGLLDGQRGGAERYPQPG
jgi:glycosyltransferase involved in cell wall biosynthesis